MVLWIRSLWPKCWISLYVIYVTMTLKRIFIQKPICYVNPPTDVSPDKFLQFLWNDRLFSVFWMSGYSDFPWHLQMAKIIFEKRLNNHDFFSSSGERGLTFWTQCVTVIDAVTWRQIRHTGIESPGTFISSI